MPDTESHAHHERLTSRVVSTFCNGYFLSRIKSRHRTIAEVDSGEAVCIGSDLIATTEHVARFDFSFCPGRTCFGNSRREHLYPRICIGNTSRGRSPSPICRYITLTF